MKNIADAFDRLLWWTTDHARLAGGFVAGFAVVGLVVILLTGGSDDKKIKIPANAAAVVGDMPITQSAVQHWQDVYTANSPANAKPTTALARKAALGVLVGAAWIQQEAKRQGVTVTDAQVNAAEQQVLAQYKGKSKAEVFAALGTSETDLRWQERISLLANKLQTKVAAAVPTVSAAKAADVYKAEPQRWAHPTSRKIRALIAASPAKAKAALAELNAGTPFATVSKKYSINPQLAKVDGVIENVKPGQNEAGFERAVFSAPIGQYRGPVALQNGGSMVFKVELINKLPDVTLAKAAPAIRTELTNEARRKAVDDFLNSMRKRWRSETACVASIKDAKYCKA